MTRPVKVTDEAVADVNGSARWYAERSLKAADAFIDEVYACYERIEQFPNGAKRVRGFIRQLPLSRFPFVILYRPIGSHRCAPGFPYQPGPEEEIPAEQVRVEGRRSQVARSLAAQRDRNTCDEVEKNAVYAKLDV